MRRGSCCAAVVLGALAFPAGALAQASRTFVSGVGDDANPCSRTAPCKTFAGAYSKTAAGGEIDVLDPGGFGALTITRSLTISATGVTAGVLVNGTNGIIVAAGAGDHVTLRGLEFSGSPFDVSPAGINGLEVTSAGRVTLEDSEIFGFSQNGIDFAPTNNATLIVTNSSIHDNTGNGVLDAPAGGIGGRVVLDNDYIDGNGCGVTAATFGLQSSSPNYASQCGVNLSGTSKSGATTITTANSSVSSNTGIGVLSAGSTATNQIVNDVVTANTYGLAALAGGSVVSVGANNSVYGNIVDGRPTSQVTTGAVGPRGARGPAGQNGKVELVTCTTTTKTVTVGGKRKKETVTKCTGRLVSGPVHFSIVGNAAHATLTRAGKVYASGEVAVGRTRAEGMLAPSRRITAGRYTLVLRENGHVVGRRSVQVG